MDYYLWVIKARPPAAAYALVAVRRHAQRVASLTAVALLSATASCGTSTHAAAFSAQPLPHRAALTGASGR